MISHNPPQPERTQRHDAPWYARACDVQTMVHKAYGPGFFRGFGAWLHEIRGETPRDEVERELARLYAERARQAKENTK